MLKVYLASISLVNDEIVNCLTDEEITKAYRFKQSDDQKRSILSSYLLKYALKVNNICETNIIYNEYGKPYLKGNDFYFNISHSGKYVVCALSKKEVGVDIERIRPTHDLVLKNCFTKEEQDYVTDDASFTKLWTLKESYIKYLGTGLKTKLNSFSVISGNLIKQIDNLVFTSMLVEDYQLSICHFPVKHFNIIHVNHPTK